MTPLLYSVPEAAVLMGVSETTVKEFLRTGKLRSVALPAADVRGRGKRTMRRIKHADIEAFIAEHEQPART